MSFPPVHYVKVLNEMPLCVFTQEHLQLQITELQNRKQLQVLFFLFYCQWPAGLQLLSTNEICDDGVVLLK